MSDADLPPIRLTGAVRPVLAALVDAGRVWISVADAARAAGVREHAARRALDGLLAARLVAYQQRPGADRQPPARVYRLTPAGRPVAESLLSTRSPGTADRSTG